jgi:hypothetical protein
MLNHLNTQAIYSLSGGKEMKPAAEIQFDLSTPLPPIATDDDFTKHHKVDLIAIQANAAEQR